MTQLEERPPTLKVNLLGLMSLLSLGLSCTDSGLVGEPEGDSSEQLTTVRSAITVGNPAEVCPGAKVTAVPAGLPSYYKKYLNLNPDPFAPGGLPLLGSEKSTPQSFRVARAIVLQMLAARADVRGAIMQSWTSPPSVVPPSSNRIAIMAEKVAEVTLNLPEYSDLLTAFPGTTAEYWNGFRGLGSTAERPLTSVGEENLMQFPSDGYLAENILIHEFGHTVWDMGVAKLPTQATWQSTRTNAFTSETVAGRWANTYRVSPSTMDGKLSEYWAEGVQDWFDANAQAVANAQGQYPKPDETPGDGFNDSADGVHNLVNTRAELETYAPAFYNIAAALFATATWPFPSGPVGGSKCLPVHRSSARVEAEDFDPAQWWGSGSQANRYDVDPANNGGAYRAGDVDIYLNGLDPYVILGNTEWLRYTIFIPNTDTYIFQLRTLSPIPNTKVKIYIDEELKDTVDVYDDATPFAWLKRSSIPITIPAGTRVVKLVPLGEISVDRFDVGFKTHDVPGVIQAEDYAAGKQGVAYNELTSGNSGGSTHRGHDVDIKPGSPTPLLTNVTEGEWLSYEIDVTLDGTYNARIYFTNGDCGQVHFEYTVDGVNFSRLTNGIALCGAGSPLTSPSFQLRRGHGLLRMHRDSGSSVDIDRLQISAGSTGSTVACGGKFVGGHCWYLGDPGQSCDAVCAGHSGYSAGSETFTGTTAQGGKLENCRHVLRSLGLDAPVSPSSRTDDLGLGCHTWSDGSLWWLDDPLLDAASATGAARRACACFR